ncbi:MULTISPECIES: 3D-(3,5/4)-trihydroxycyclohexane-1,2-dione acylhydrolase (decyclizing) [unclassified Paenibacillus]|uniref:3D-(3,5/4)-trihydroxycyclohexane-1,2-dione acylhydrolase (decyclizing) n=1 Tax=unclassified Paenibacillus TaxID=185978 RepID=UPI002406AD33|nr:MULTISPECIES: 3D-(3,5/4)-trihydroxycyclohexane-1,2-dione acylhydrolase (decyclizing) [unclassified Paenibacillus]MDF9840802.1 3D-(3,5/4)-trihydroxycyclohexane-1,2-dione acylhydrolase (decyclizing) [Paenibacillus sp. PastF-2]MDF9847385.1 3D-(3,5/4)-trihydroxycyclohexane-1,2-dione acylhydrolase (decyclizing) [Paenibacillus sp. PastM-2]MDF9854037.1 3D-(3,5/4)-trihydroxycyclohexane-1,2-dione acylhydrolase (decyclizing) [Paenibacillus sp. PastF-1]MDH6479310.1 3D-(3,5/4)-trihydroxycyclohexane-1,2-
MERIRLTTAQALVKFLNEQYVDFGNGPERFVEGVFTVFGHGNVLGLGQALQEAPGGLKIFQGRNEQGMVHAATAFAKQSRRRRIMACTASVGPGSANMLTAAATATANQIPVLLLPGDTFATRQPDPVLQQMEHTYNLSITVNDAFKAVSKYWDRIYRPEQLMSALLNAMRVLTDQADTGAVTIALPQDIQGEAWDYPADFFRRRVHKIARRLPHPDEIAAAAELIASKHRPLLVCGGGVRYSVAGAALRDFAEKFAIPFGETQAGKSAVASDFAYNLGGLGVTGNGCANTLAAEADLVIGAGTRFTDFTTGSKSLFAHPGVEFVTLNASPYHAAKLDALAVVCDAAEGLKALSVALEQRGYRSAFTDEITEAKQAWAAERARLAGVEYRAGGAAAVVEAVAEAAGVAGCAAASGAAAAVQGDEAAPFVPEIAGHLDDKLPEYAGVLNTSLTQTQVLAIINELIPQDAIVIGAAGSLPGDMQRMWESAVPDTYHMEYGFSCMGYEIAGALGIKLAEPEREVYALVGDGSYQMMHSELVTSLQENRKINVLLLDNAGFGCINNLQMEQGLDSMATEFRRRGADGQLSGELMLIDYAASAAGYGVETFRAATAEQLRSALEAARKSEKSTLIDIKVLPKTMTHGYGAWWHVGVAEVSGKESVQAAYGQKLSGLEKARSY